MDYTIRNNRGVWKNITDCKNLEWLADYTIRKSFKKFNDLRITQSTSVASERRRRIWL